MPNTLKEWLWFIAVAVCFLSPSFSKADDLAPCIARGRVAFVMVMGVATGTPLDQINVYFHSGKQMTTDEAYVNGVREEVRPLLGDVPAAGTPEAEPYAYGIGNKITQACAYELGVKRGYHKRVASSQSIQGPAIGTEEVPADREGVRTAQCNELLTDQRYIADSVAKSIPTQRLLQEAMRSGAQLGEDRLKRIKELIAEADSAARKAVREWFEAYWHACVDGV